MKSKKNPKQSYRTNYFKMKSGGNIEIDEAGGRIKLPSLWTHSYYCESVGRLSEGAVKRYIESQKSAAQENKERIKRAFFS